MRFHGHRVIFRLRSALLGVLLVEMRHQRDRGMGGVEMSTRVIMGRIHDCVVGAIVGNQLS